MSPNICDGRGVLILFFPLFGLTIGDCLTLRVLRGFGGALLLPFRGSICVLPGAD